MKLNLSKFPKKLKLSRITIDVLIIFGALTGLVYYYSLKANDFYADSVFAAIQPDLISGRDWTHLAGATQDASGVHVKPLGRAIVNQDGTGGQPNPPVNVPGSHLEVSGDFELSLRAKDLSDKTASLRLYAAVPIIYDEWRYDGPSLDIGIKADKVTLSIWDGSKADPLEVKSFTMTQASEAVLTVKHVGKSVVVFSGSTQLGTMPDHNIFASRKIWFGLDAEVGGNGWTLTSLNVHALHKAKLQIVSAPNVAVPHSDPNALRNLSKRPLIIGTAIADYPLLSDDTYRNLAGGQFSMLTPENAMKPQFIHPQANVYSFEEADTLVDFAKANGMQVHGHALVFGEANPKWMQDTPLNQRQQVMIDHIQTVVNHYKGKVSEWDVVNEPLANNDESDTTSPDIRQTIWYRAMGEQYIDIAFQTAHQVDPSAKLYINDFGLEADGDRWDSMLALLQRLKSRGVPIDGVGFQAHVYEDGDQIGTATLQKHIEELQKFGFSSRISEMDVTGVDAGQQAEQYASVLKVCLAEPSCTSFTTWGITDKYGSTTMLHSYPPDYGDDLLWEANYLPKPAYKSLQATLAK